jgi:hypothetical protein
MSSKNYGSPISMVDDASVVFFIRWASPVSGRVNRSIKGTVRRKLTGVLMY